MSICGSKIHKLDFYKKSTYEPIPDNRSEPLQVRLQVEERLIGFYREDTGEKLLIPDELAQALGQEVLARQSKQRNTQNKNANAQNKQNCRFNN
ncbi:hypothetical protein NIES4073_69560 [Kalymmatonema gypsitolerans NIES-4073]|nr:hypothetical protein NIES4073_69560 [Scytonema sp. NIES-4073]